MRTRRLAAAAPAAVVAAVAKVAKVAKVALVATAAHALAACIAPPGPSERLAESAYEMNTATRFGRMDVALEFVASAARDDFTRRHAGWGRELRVVDVELTGFQWNEGGEASVFLSVSWQRLDEARLRVTQLEQRWKDGRGGFRMASEGWSGGDIGLLGERSQRGAPAKEPRISQKGVDAPESLRAAESARR